jgi:DNA polymerase-3 subunit epsilon
VTKTAQYKLEQPIDCYCYTAWLRFGDGIWKENQTEELTLEQVGEAQVVEEVFPSWPLSLCFLDLETTGLSTAKDRIIEICAQTVYPDGQVGEYYALVDPGIPIPYQASQVHGIYDRDVKGKPRFPAVAVEVYDYFKGKTLVAHNGNRFDIPLLAAEFTRCGLIFSPPCVVDTQAIAQQLYGRGATALGKLATKYGVPSLDAHSARGDVETLRAIWPRLLSALAEKIQKEQIDER